jgi:hypothetical protein
VENCEPGNMETVGTMENFEARNIETVGTMENCEPGNMESVGTMENCEARKHGDPMDHGELRGAEIWRP